MTISSQATDYICQLFHVSCITGTHNIPLLHLLQHHCTSIQSELTISAAAVEGLIKLT
jgi:hypothetical protein